ncbi:LURP-one-related/scramblase family protein [Allonocardiopsis opalescens]|uniref:Uncharacterized protein YxjI n=1 Tax=Allonocardiopsis opalescens TaxID=1144618 RepID=A0A2T0QA08_9ACTN|nr:phospholipid scramblase-related protein [Allonocardiopsis opalescens]PRY00675.1 uncharacterized protein YxjI [Allonocardiopsis opalescens]
MTDLFNSPVLLVDQPKRFFVDQSEYHVFNGQGQRVAHVHEINLSAGMQVLRFMAESTTGFRRQLAVNDAYGRPLFLIDKSWELFTATTSISVPNGPVIGYIDQDFKLLKSSFRLLDGYKRLVGTISGDFWGWDFALSDANGLEVARVNKQYAGLTAEVFTAADRYALHMRYGNLPEPLRTLVIASGVTIDLVLQEGKR